MNNKEQRSSSAKIFFISVGILIGLTALFYLIFNIDGLNKIFAPIVTGIVIAFLLSPILSFYEYRIFSWKKTNRLRKNLCLACSMIMTILTAVAIIALIWMLIIPQFVESITQLITNYEQYLNNLVDFINNTVNKVKESFYKGDSYEYKNVIEYGQIQEYIGKLFSSGDSEGSNISSFSQIFESIVPLVQNIGLGIFDIVKNLIIGIFLAIYILISKDVRRARMRKLRRAFLTPKQDEFFMDVSRITNRNFNGFIKGKLIDSLIIGLLTYVLFEVFSISEYNMLNATIVGITNVIPMFGPIFGAIPVAFIVLISNPQKFLLSLILILIIQELDGNLIGPKILGDSTNVSSLTVIVSITVMGSIFGVFGMIIGVPVFATVIAIVNKIADNKLEQKGEPTDVEEYFSGISLVDPHRVAHKEEHTWMYRYEHSEAKVRIDAFLAKFKKSNKNK